MQVLTQLTRIQYIECNGYLLRYALVSHIINYPLLKWSCFGAFEFKIQKISFDRKPKHELT
jgi:hypothetical protein